MPTHEHVNAAREEMIDVMLNPEKYGWKECPHCHGYGSSLVDHEDVLRCTRCDGSGLIKMTVEEALSKKKKPNTKGN